MTQPLLKTDVQVLPHLDNGPALLVFLSPRRFELMSPADARVLRERIDDALAQLQPQQLDLLGGVA